MTFDSFVDDQKTIDAVLLNLEIIGEAAKQVSQATRDRAPDIEWRKITGLRDLIVHAYFLVDPQIIWDMVENKLDELQRGVQRLLGE